MQISLRAARINAGLTQQQVEEKTGIARSTLTRWEKGETKPSQSNLVRICDLYQIAQSQIVWNRKTRRHP